MGEEQEQKFHQLTEEPVSRMISHLAVPCIISMLVTAFYNMADTFFVGMLRSNAATGAVGVVFSMMAVIQAVGFFFGHGSGNFISRELGRRNTDSASNMAATGFFSALFTGLLICVFGEIFLTPLAAFLGSSPTILPYAKDYLRVILIGAPWMTASLVLNNQLRFQGNAIYGTIGIASGAVLNIGLDPLLIFVFDLGVAGAAWATIISQFAGFCLLLAGCTRGATLHIHISRVQLKWSYFKLIIQGGLPSLARQSLASVATICLNHAAMPYGDAAIAAMGVIVGSDIPMFIGAMVMGPLGGYTIRWFDKLTQGRIKAGFEMLVSNFSIGILGMLLAILGYWVIGGAVTGLTLLVSNGVEVVIRHGLLPLVSLLVEPSKVLFLNNALNHGIFSPIGIEQARETGQSIMFLLETNPGPGLGVLLACWFFGRGNMRQSAPGAVIIQFFGGIHEIYFPYILARPALILAPVAGSAAGLLFFSLAGAGLVAPASPGSIISVLAMAPKGQTLVVLAGVLISTAGSLLMAGPFIRQAQSPPRRAGRPP